MTRPVVAGHEWVWVVDTSPALVLLLPGAAPRRCGRCDNPAVAVARALAQPRCAQHLSGRRLRDGVLEVQVLRPIGVTA